MPTTGRPSVLPESGPLITATGCGSVLPAYAASLAAIATWIR